MKLLSRFYSRFHHAGGVKFAISRRLLRASIKQEHLESLCAFLRAITESGKRHINKNKVAVFGTNPEYRVVICLRKSKQVPLSIPVYKEYQS